MWKKWLSLTVKILVSGALIWLLLSRIDLAAAEERVLKVAPEMLVLAVFLVVVQIVVANFRWRAVLGALPEAMLSFRRTLRILYIGFFFNQALPSSVGGDAVRMALMYRAGVPLAQAISGVFLERAANILALVAVVAGAVPFFIGNVVPDRRLWVWGVVAALLIAALGGLVFLIVLERLPESLQRWRLARGLVGLAGDARRVFLAPRYAVRAVAWSVIGFVNVTLFVYLLARGLELKVSWTDCLVLIPPVLLAATLPISIAGWGVREGAMVAALGLVGVPSSGALVLSILVGLIPMLVCLPGGVVWMLSTERRGEALDTASSLEAGSGETGTSPPGC